ncbi:guanylate-binding protein 6-like, partial [Empidonax traillii]|uniref:guanylate-binding protein 6-like n=1 Tax=Empidonax traillii TaxID=164674 RepID=UPI000FFD9AD2
MGQLDALAAGQEGLSPVCLVENSQEQGLVVYSEALRVLSGVKQPVVVVAAIRSDQEVAEAVPAPSLSVSPLCNTRVPPGVSVGSPPNRMWMFCLPHPHLRDHTLVLLHTEVHLDEGDLESSRWLLVLTLLLCSSLIHTSHGDITQQDMDRLRWLSELPKLITCRENPERGALSDSHRFALFFPDFVWAVMDCARELQDEDGWEISEDEYLERALRLQPGTDAQAQRHNLPQECIRQFFLNRRCFLIQGHLEETPAGLQEQKFLTFLREEAQTKTLPGGLVVTGELLGRLAEIYVGQIRAGAVPCLERAIRDVAPAANAAAVAAALQRYREQMEGLELPVDTVTELLQLHRCCELEALELFMERAFPDGICNGQAEFMRQVEALKDKFFLDNERLSRARCEKTLQNLSRDMETRNRDRSHGLPGGYLQALVVEYWKLPGKGLKAAAVLQEFLRSRSIRSAERSIRAWSNIGGGVGQGVCRYRARGALT